MSKVLLLISGEECGSAIWTAFPTLATKLQHSARPSLKMLKGGEKIRISCDGSQEVVLFSEDDVVFKDNLIKGFRELESLMRERKKTLAKKSESSIYGLRDIAML